MKRERVDTKEYMNRIDTIYEYVKERNFKVNISKMCNELTLNIKRVSLYVYLKKVEQKYNVKIKRLKAKELNERIGNKNNDYIYQTFSKEHNFDNIKQMTKIEIRN